MRARARPRPGAGRGSARWAGCRAAPGSRWAEARRARSPAAAAVGTVAAVAVVGQLAAG